MLAKVIQYARKNRKEKIGIGNPFVLSGSNPKPTILGFVLWGTNSTGEYEASASRVS